MKSAFKSNIRQGMTVLSGLIYTSMCFDVDHSPSSCTPCLLLAPVLHVCWLRRNFLEPAGGETRCITHHCLPLAVSKAKCCWPCLCLRFSNTFKQLASSLLLTPPFFDKPDKQSVWDEAGPVSSLCLLTVSPVIWMIFYNLMPRS